MGITTESFFSFYRISDFELSPDLKWGAFVRSQLSVSQNKKFSQLMLYSLQDGSVKTLTDLTHCDSHPRWSPNGKYILFESNRSGNSQLWLKEVHGEQEPEQLTDFPSGAYHGKWSPQGDAIAFHAPMYPEFDTLPFEVRLQKMREKNSEDVSNVKVYTDLFYRHFNAETEGLRTHLYYARCQFENIETITGLSDYKDLTPGDRDVAAKTWLNDTSAEICFAPDGLSVYYSPAPRENESWSTAYSLHQVSVNGEWNRCLVPDALAAHSTPAISPDGTRLAFRAQKKHGHEADQWKLYIKNLQTGETECLTENNDFTVHSLKWMSEKSLLVATEERARRMAYVIETSGALPKAVRSEHSLLCVSPLSKVTFIGISSSYLYPGKITQVSLTGIECVLYDPNPELTSLTEDIIFEDCTVPTLDQLPMQVMLMRPKSQTPLPLVFWVHGGPQVAFWDSWNERWNPLLWASQGYAIALPNPRGSTGFGQAFVDAISKDWSGKVVDDLKCALDYVKTRKEIDPTNIAAAGASFGGYMMNWMATHWKGIKTYVVHCGIFNLESFYATDELWFPEWEFGGAPWEVPENYARMSPHRYAQNLHTPTLVIHNQKDYRTTLNQGEELFTALRRQNVPAKFINFTDEGHWVIKPKNARRWHEEIFSWLKSYL